MDSDLNSFKARFQRLLELREERDIATERAKKTESAYREAESELYEAIEEAGIRGRISFDFGAELGTAKFQLRSTNYGRIIDKDVALSALKAEGLGEVIYEEAIRARRLNELVRDRLENGADLPDGIDYYPRKGISISRK